MLCQSKQNIFNSSQVSKQPRKLQTLFSTEVFLDALGQLTLLYVVQSGQIWNKSRILCIPLLSATL